LILLANCVGPAIPVKTGRNSDSNDGKTLEKPEHHEFASNINLCEPAASWVMVHSKTAFKLVLSHSV